MVHSDAQRLDCVFPARVDPMVSVAMLREILADIPCRARHPRTAQFARAALFAISRSCKDFLIYFGL